MYRSSNFNSTFHLIYYLCSMWHTQNFVNYITICRLLMLKRKRGLCLRHFIAWVIRVLHTFLQVSWFFFFFKARRWAELICGLYLTYFGRSKFGIKILKRRRKKNSQEKPPNWHPYPDSFVWLVKNKPHFSKKKNHAPFFYSKVDHSMIKTT